MQKLSVTPAITLAFIACSLRACGSASTPTPSFHTATLPPTYTPAPLQTRRPSQTPLPPPTQQPFQTRTAIVKNVVTKESPIIDCRNEASISPSKHWRICPMGNDFNVVNQNGTFWHFSTQEQFGTNYDNGPNLLHWTGNEKFLYFAFINSIGGPGPVRPNAEVLFRMDLSTGNVVIVLGSIPRTYEEWVIHPFFIISISPTSRRLAYVAYRSSQLKLHVLDLQSGTKETIPVEPEYNLIGEITWSETGEQLVYMLYHYTDNFGYDSCSYTYAIRWLDLRDDSTTTFIKNIAMDPCIDYSASSYQAVSVSPDQVILKRGEEMWEYDVKSQKLNLQVTVTPSP